MKCEKGLQIAIPMVLCLLLVLPASAALSVSGIVPNSDLNTGTVFITNLSGTDFPDQGDVLVSLNMTGQTNITAQYVTVASPTKITCVFDLTDKMAGDWDVTVINTSSWDTVVLPGGFSVENPAPEVASITPDNGVNDAPVQITNLAGSNFLSGAIVNLTLGPQVITATDVNVTTPSKITCEFNITYADPGDWDVVVTNYDGKSDTLTQGFTIRYPVPIVSSVTPSTGINNQVIGITNLSGSGFMPGANVTLRKAGESDILTINGPIVSSNKILCFFDLNSVHVGEWDVVVTNLDGQEGILPQGFSIYYPDAPVATGILPDTGMNTGSVLANVTGTGFHGNATVTLSRGVQDIPGTGVFVYSGSDIGVKFNLTGMPAGLWDLTVTNEDGQTSTKADAFTITNPPPTVLSVDPASGPNTGWFTISNITGTGFISGAQVTFTRGATSFDASSVSVASSTLLSCNVDLSGREAGVYDITVTNTDGLFGTKAAAFTIVNPAPVINSITPSTGENTGPVDILSLSGENFLDGAGVNLTKSGETSIPGTPVTWINSTTLTCTFDLTGKAAGAWTVEVINPDGRSDEYLGLFTITNPPPQPQAIIPATAPNNGPVGITSLTGTGFLPGATPSLVKGSSVISGTSVDVNVTTQTIMCFFNLNGVQVGEWDVTVNNTDGQSGTLPAGFFVTYPSAPTVTGIDPSYGVNNGPVAITNLSGTGFHSGASVLLTRSGESDIIATGVTVPSQNQITCTFNLSGKPVGFWNVVVINDDDQSGMLADGFEVKYPAPTVSSLTPNKGNNNQVVSITNLAGTNFRSGASVKLNRTSQPDIVASSVIVVSPTQITCTLNLNGKAVGDWDVVVANTDGQSYTKANGFTIEYPAPTVSSITPQKGSNDGTLFISALAGNYFRTGAEVRLTRSTQTDIVATNVQVIDANTLNCTVNLNGKATGNWNVVVTNIDGKSGTLANGFQVLPPAPIPDFSASPTYGTAPMTVQFTDLTQNNPSTWIWDFGDGSVSGILDQNPVHTYNAVGTYNVTLTVFNAGAPDGRVVTKENYIVVVRTPVADFTASPTSGNAPLLVQFTDTSDGNPNFWVWKFGDGTMSSTQNPFHLYTAPGVYSVSLTVKNTAGSDTVTKEDLITVRALPVADFIANRTSGAAPLTVRYTDQSTGVPSSWSWVFGDGATSTDQNPVHTYSTPGTYNVRLTVANSAGTDTETKNGYITVREGMEASFSYTTSNPGNLAPLTVAFTDTSTGSPTQWIWNFGDGFISLERNPIHTYTTRGNYTATLTVSDAMQGSSASKTIEVKQRLFADFNAQPSTGSVPLTVRLTDQSIGVPNTWTWVISKDQFNVTLFDPGSSTEIYTFNEPGMYDVRLTVTDAFGNTDTVLKSDIIEVLPFP
ncbi:MAG: PKD domain-containing protein [Methanolinea sp.]|jgi:PKD repeat protein|nr:PKD domain-containing protein [Methanolinea sp.]